MLTRVLLLNLLLGLCHGLRQLDAEVVFPDDDLTTISPDGYALFGTSDISYFGVDGHNLGDINGDGLDDLIFGQHLYGDNGRVVVVFGNSTERPSMTVTTAVEPPYGFQITSTITSGRLGYSIDSGDFNNDDRTDLLISGWNDDGVGYLALLWGPDDDTWTNIEVTSTMDSSVGVIFATEVSTDFFGNSVVSLGDINNDEFDDFAVGAPVGDDPEFNIGRVFIVFGSDSLTSTTLDTTNSLRITGPMTKGAFGWSLAAADFNNDSILDLVVGASYAPMDSSINHGRVYVILCDETMTVGAMDMSEFVSGDTAGMYIEGDVANRQLGNALGGACDVNGDGIHDIIIGVTVSNIDGVSGIAVVLLGRVTGFEALNVETMTLEDGFVITGGDPSTEDRFGSKVGCLGSVNGDQYDDYYVTHKDDDGMYATTVFYGRAEISNFTIVEEQSNSHEVANTYIALNAGNHLGEGTTSVAFASHYPREKAGSAFMMKDFPSYFITQSPTTSSPTVSPSSSPTEGPTGSPTTSPTTIPSRSPSQSPSVSPSISPTTSPTDSPSSSPTSAPSTSPTEPQCEMSISTSGGAGLTWEVTDDEGDEEIASGEFGGEALDFTLLASEEYLLFLSSDTVPAGTSITVTVNGQDTVIPLEQGLTTSTEIAGVTCEAISNKIASIDSGYSSTSVLLALLMVFL